jgi:dGTP triphosphohydrolase
MSLPKFSKDQIQKLGLSVVGFVFLLYIYFNFFLGPLNKSRDSMTARMADVQSKIDNSKEDMNKAVRLEQQAKAAIARFAALKGLSPEGAPIAWFPPRIKLFFANQQIDRAVARMEGNSALKQPELSAWMKYSWIIEAPQAEFASIGKAIAELENAEPLLSITKLNIRAVADKPQFQQLNLAASNIIEKR